ncbi:DnaJ-domain-containing protein [Bimuria novae-zelandiae CBS 107.79]|uniref:DnaJ-domain-containing protein n=1 Tax=Bimuria novae-zelandiae CBS 107.79 TaxID=1447943 RepID=A0A6A5VL78_9PLEO|nr:DnaJ-domain-containing protein [Bimuria novae-zelandiae CBS 107.79]
MFENSPSARDLYADLGVGPDASFAEIKAAFHRLARQHHPDKKDPNDHDSSEFRNAYEAYETLYNAQSRAQYDEARGNKSKNADNRPFNVFNPRTSQSSSNWHANAKFHDQGTEFEEEEPMFGNKSDWTPRYDRTSSAPQGIPISHGLRVLMTDHPASSTADRKCPYSPQEWPMQSGTEVCIYCLKSSQGAFSCPACQAVACAECRERIEEVIKEKPHSWHYGPQSRSSSG